MHLQFWLFHPVLMSAASLTWITAMPLIFCLFYAIIIVLFCDCSRMTTLFGQSIVCPCVMCVRSIFPKKSRVGVRVRCLENSLSGGACSFT